MCPDRELLSAWVDGEVPSPWYEKIQNHVANCNTCKKSVDEFSALKNAFTQDSGNNSQTIDAIQEKVFERLSLDDNLNFDYNTKSSNSIYKKNSIWGKHFSIPFPAVAAAVLLFAVMAFGLLRTNKRNTELELAMDRVENAVPVSASGIGMESIMDLVSSQGSAVNINITLPAEAFSGKASDPVLIREADYNQGANW